MAAQTTRALSGFTRYAWTVFAGLGALFVLLDIWPVIFAETGRGRQFYLDFMLIHVLWIVLAVFGVRRGERWAWYTMALWPLWLIVSSFFGGLPHT